MTVMRPLRAHPLSVLAMLVLLLGTAAPALARMTCVMDGHTVMSVGQPEDCCPDEQPDQAALKATCCEVLQAQPLRSAFIPVVSAMVPVPVAILPRVTVCLPQLIASITPEEIDSSAPPPLERSQRMAATGVFRI